MLLTYHNFICQAFVVNHGRILSLRHILPSTRRCRNRNSPLLHYTRRKRQSEESFSDRDSFMKSPEEILSSNFWGSVTTVKQSSSSVAPLPNVPTLDQEGPLPEGAYIPSSSSSQCCRIGVALDIPSLWVHLKEERIESHDMVGKLHNYIESGFQTFHLRCQTAEQQQWTETNLLGKFYSETPSFCRNQCHFTIPYSITAQQQEMTGTTVQRSHTIRQSILEILDRTGAEVIDCLQLRGLSSSSSPYFFDIVDILQDMKREGYIASIDAHQLPLMQQMLAHEYGFSLNAMHWDANLLDLSKYQDQIKHNRQTKQDNHPLIVSSPLAGGLLTERYFGQHEMPKSWEFRYMERFYWNTIYDEWAKRTQSSRRKTTDRKQHRKSVWSDDQDEEDDDSIDQAELWTVYQTEILSTLHRIARKYSVSIPSVVLRWMLQLDKVSGTIVTCQLLYPDDGLARKPRERQLRQVFTFALDEQDMIDLWGITGLDVPTSGDAGELDLLLDDDSMMQETNGLFIPSKKRSR